MLFLCSQLICIRPHFKYNQSSLNYIFSHLSKVYSVTCYMYTYMYFYMYRVHIFFCKHVQCVVHHVENLINPNKAGLFGGSFF